MTTPTPNADAHDLKPAAIDAQSRNAALTLALALPGDTVLYLLLPIYHAAFGVTLPEAGVLLAANRLVRIIGYTHVAQFYSTFGPRAACVAAVTGALISTAGYALLSGVWPLVVMRLVWGLSFAALNIATQAIPTAVADGAAKRSGRVRAIIASGPMLGLVFAALTVGIIGPRGVFAVLAAIVPIALFTVSKLPSTPEAMRIGGPRFAWPEAINVWAFVSGFALDGIFVFGVALLAAQWFPTAAALAAGSVMALRYASEMLLSTSGGWLAHRFGALRMLIVLSLAAAAAFAAIGTPGAPAMAAVLVVTLLRALLQPLPAPVVAAQNPGPEMVPALARQATWRDIGAGLGPLAAGIMFPALPSVLIYSAMGIALAASVLPLINRRAMH